jgi:hypothetical protein
MAVRAPVLVALDKIVSPRAIRNPVAGLRAR